MTSAVEASSVETPPEETPAVERRTVASKLMLAMAVLLALALAGSIFALWRETQPREVLTGSIDDRLPVDPQATYFGTTLKKDSLVTGTGAMIASIPFC